MRLPAPDHLWCRRRQTESGNAGIRRTRAGGVLLCLIAVSFCLFAGPSPAHSGETIVQAQLLVVPRSEQQPAYLLVHFQIPPGWYLYWLNPGDAGLPPEARWKVPQGYTVGPAEFPVPRKLVHGELVAYGYLKELLLRWPLKSPSPAGGALPDSVSVALDWLVCKESCIPEQRVLRWQKNGANVLAARLLQAWKQRFPTRLNPGALRLAQLPALKRKAGLLYRYRLLGDSATAVVDLYPVVKGTAIVKYRDIRIAGRVVEVPVSGVPPEENILTDALAITRRGAFWVGAIVPAR